MTNRERVLAVFQYATAHQELESGAWGIFLTLGQTYGQTKWCETEEAAWQNAAEPIPAQPAVDCCRGLAPAHECYINCGGTKPNPLPPASTNSPAIPAKEECKESEFPGPIPENCPKCGEPIWGEGWNPKTGVRYFSHTPVAVEAKDKPTNEREQEVVAVRANDKPPIHWKENDGWKRHPQTVEEWNWHDDHVGGGGRRSELRINFALDQADPHAPDQMAQVLRIDLMRITARMHSAEAYKRLSLAKKASHPSNQPTQKEAQGFEEWWVTYDEKYQELPSRYESAKAAWNAALSHKEKL